ncbi:transposase IS116 [Salmonella enterica]|uniref:Transposase IS116 n=1 Tax=Salmonella enterica TaxID=28901 RepID=A0A379QHH3_SALER|nr:transposase IS116 [Salmonella enterica]
MRRTIAELYDLFNDLERRIHFLIRKLKQYSDNQKPVSVSPKLKALVLKRHGRCCCYWQRNEWSPLCCMAGSGSTPAFEWRQAGADEYDEKRRQASATLFIHGARAVVRVATNNNDGHMNQWVNQLKERRGFNKTTVAVANKNARIIWSMLRNDTEYQVV